MRDMKVLLMVPVTAFVRHAPLFPDLGLGYLAAAVKKAGHDVHLLSWNMNLSVEGFRGCIKEKKFDVIGLKVFTKDVAAANKTIEVIKSVSPETVIIVGGPHPSTSEPEDALSDFPLSDFIFRGEAEIGLPLFLEYILKNKGKVTLDMKNIPGLVWKNEEKVEANEPLLAEDINAFGTPLWEMMHPKDYRAPKIPGGNKKGYSAPIIVTRGCSSKCTYCAAYKINGKKVRVRSPQLVLDEIRHLYDKYNVRHLFFMDTRFLQNADVVSEICEGIIKANMEIAWDCVGYEDLETLSPEMLALMKKAGCGVINMGIESGSEKIRKVIKKRGEIKDILRNVHNVKKVGIGIRAFFMIGFPGETKKDIEDTVNFAFSLPAESLQFEIACPHPGTELLQFLRMKYGVDKIDWENFDVYKSPYPLSEMGSSELFRILRGIRRRYFFASLKKRFSILGH